MKPKLINKSKDLYYWKGFYFTVTKYGATGWVSHANRSLSWRFDTRIIDIGGTCFGDSKGYVISQTKKRILELRKKLSIIEKIVLIIHKKKMRILS